MRKKRKNLIVLIVGFTLAMASLFYFRDKQMIRSNDNPEIRSISIDYKKNGIYGTLDLSNNEISKDLNDRLVFIFNIILLTLKGYIKKSTVYCLIS